MKGQPAKKRDVWHREKVSKASMGYTRRILLPPGNLSRPVLIPVLLLKIFMNICQYLQEGAQYFEQAKRRSIGVRKNLSLSSERCSQMICLLSSKRFESALLSLNFSGSGDQTLISLILKNQRRIRFHESLRPTAYSLLIFLHQIPLYHRQINLFAVRPLGPTSDLIALPHHARAHLPA